MGIYNDGRFILRRHRRLARTRWIFTLWLERGKWTTGKIFALFIHRMLCFNLTINIWSNDATNTYFVSFSRFYFRIVRVPLWIGIHGSGDMLLRFYRFWYNCNDWRRGAQPTKKYSKSNCWLVGHCINCICNE